MGTHSQFISIKGFDIPYISEFRKVKYARIELLPTRSLRVILPKSKKINAENFLMENYNWIKKKVLSLNETLNDLGYHWETLGQELTIFGKNYELKIKKGFETVFIEGSIITASAVSKNKAYQVLKEHLKKKVRTRIEKWAEVYSKKLNVKFNRIFIKEQETLWGSCSSRGNINFNLKSVVLPDDLLEFLVAHELLHRKISNHGSNFKQKMKELFNDYHVKERHLRAYWFISHANPLFTKKNN